MQICARKFKCFVWTIAIYCLNVINDFSQASSIFKFIMYADDTTLFSTLASFSDNLQYNTTEYLINTERSKVVEWLNINKLSLIKQSLNI